MKKLGLVTLSTAALMAGISVASAGAPVSRDSTDLPGAKTSELEDAGHRGGAVGRCAEIVGHAA